MSLLESVEERRHRALEIIAIMQKETRKMAQPVVFSLVERFGKDPFIVLISCLLSLRTKDTISLPVCLTLFERIRAPGQLLALERQELMRIIYSVGFYRKKAIILHEVCQQLIDRFAGKVPNTLENLLSLPGVGRKTANLVLGEGFDIPAICVDTHVHRISNRLGLVASKTPEETEKQLMAILPQQYWIEWNRLLVMWGQNICVPLSPWCSRCPVRDLCKRVDVTKSR